VYTQCPECNAVYRVTSAHLRVAGGEVQCGACDTRFDALDRLSDTYPKGLGGPVGEAAEPTEDSSAAAETAREADVETPTGGETEETGEAAPEAELVDDESPGEQPIEVEAEKPAESEGEQETAAADEQHEPTGPALAEAEVAESPTDETQPDDEAKEKITAVSDDEEPTIALDVTAEELFSVSELRDQELPDISDTEFVEGLPSGQPEDAGTAELAPPGEMVSRQPSSLLRRTRRLFLPALLLALVAMIVHSQRGSLMRQPDLAPVLRGVYGVLGLDVEPAWDVAAYRIVDSAAEIDSGGDLQVTVTFVNEAEFPQPYPVLRVSLEDRWGDEIGSRQLLPGQYVAGFSGGQTIPSGEQVEGQATVTAPPTAAVGFRLDLCLANAAGQLDCMSNQP
jgi:predicted Zn finger-like uncharacterized protein